MIYYDPDDPERGYFTEDETVTSRFSCGESRYVGDPEDPEDEAFRVEEAPCSICGGQIPDDAKYPLCTICELTARAHAKLETDARRYPDPERMRR